MRIGDGLEVRAAHICITGRMSDAGTAIHGGRTKPVAPRMEEQVPEECREISHVASDGEIHRADIKTPTGIVIEVQHSAMTDTGRLSREAVLTAPRALTLWNM